MDVSMYFTNLYRFFSLSPVISRPALPATAINTTAHMLDIQISFLPIYQIAYFILVSARGNLINIKWFQVLCSESVSDIRGVNANGLGLPYDCLIELLNSKPP